MKLFGGFLFAIGSLGMALGGMATVWGLLLVGPARDSPEGLGALVAGGAIVFGLYGVYMSLGVTTLGWAIRRYFKISARENGQ
jgi:hypothetical protein